MPKDASGFWTPTSTWTGTAVTGDGAHSGADPTSDNGTGALGLDISDCTGFRFLVSTASGKTLTSYSAVVWLYSTSLARWVHCSQLDYTPTIAAATYRDDVTPDFQCSLGFGRAYLQLVNPSASTSANVTPQGEGGKFNAGQ